MVPQNHGDGEALRAAQKVRQASTCSELYGLAITPYAQCTFVMKDHPRLLCSKNYQDSRALSM